ncbi:hypothetical protein [Sphingobacterium thalpophilum]|uniref:DUF4397 domain-containing protein n=1 Tax=Sphingobacterium thalpophilum TaxID=259 RepID=A0A4U9VP99_9SPHI|nr:hypothetical protein [Sphingobacterium thalpophilum]VTR48097.1 Uncharacterised protein [Sphingobacterium thalpophilum]
MRKIDISKLLHLFLLTAVLLQACQKGELFESATPKIVQITFAGSTTVPLDFFYGDAIVASTGEQNNTLPNPIKLNTTGGDQKIYIRQKGKSEVLKTYTIAGTDFSNVINIYYDNGKIYDAGINYKLQIYAKNSGLDFYLDNQRIYQNPYEGPTQETLTIPIDKGQQRMLTVRKVGADDVLISKTITDADSNAVLKFYLDGNDLLEHLTVPALKNPKAMSVTFKLQTDIPFGETKFVGGDIDIIPYIRDINTGAIKKPSPELRFTVSTKASFTTIELPPISESEYYTFDLARKGTNEPAFASTNSGKKVKLGLGNYGVFFLQSPETAFFLPGVRVICILSVTEETGGNNFDELFVTPTISEYLANWINFQ